MIFLNYAIMRKKGNINMDIKNKKIGKLVREKVVW